MAQTHLLRNGTTHGRLLPESIINQENAQHKCSLWVKFLNCGPSSQTTVGCVKVSKAYQKPTHPSSSPNASTLEVRTSAYEFRRQHKYSVHYWEEYKHCNDVHKLSQCGRNGCLVIEQVSRPWKDDWISAVVRSVGMPELELCSHVWIPNPHSRWLQLFIAVARLIP